MGIHLWCTPSEIQVLGVGRLQQSDDLVDGGLVHLLFAGRARIDMAVQTSLIAAVTEVDLHRFERFATKSREIRLLQKRQGRTHERYLR